MLVVDKRSRPFDLAVTPLVRFCRLPIGLQASKYGNLQWVNLQLVG